MTCISTDTDTKNTADTGSFVSQGNIHHLSSHLHKNLYISSNIKHYEDYTELIYIQSDILIALQITECEIMRSAM